jgi:PIN domain nuclease of toxin-antitoxin system
VNLFDASALLVYLRGEPGADLVEAHLDEADPRCGAANWSEVAQKVRSHGRDWGLARALLLGHGLVVEPVTLEDAERAAAIWRRGDGHSLADRLCLALSERLRAVVWTADRTWTGERVRQVRGPGRLDP